MILPNCDDCLITTSIKACPFSSVASQVDVPPPLSQLLKHKADVNFVNEHGNTAMHYACFWQFEDCAEDLLECGALVSIENKYGESPVDKAPPRLAKRLMGKS